MNEKPYTFSNLLLESPCVNWVRIALRFLLVCGPVYVLAWLILGGF